MNKLLKKLILVKEINTDNLNGFGTEFAVNLNRNQLK